MSQTRHAIALGLAAMVAAASATTSATASTTEAATNGAVTGTVAGTEVVASRAAASGSLFDNRPWGVYKGFGDQSWRPYLNASGSTKTAIGTIALTPKAKWFGDWIPTGEIRAKVKDYVANSQKEYGREALVQATIFRVEPWEHAACKRLPKKSEKRDYRRWIDEFATGLGDAPTAIVLQPDGPFALCAPGGSKVYSNLVKYAAKRLEQQRRTDVYIEAGAYDWPNVGRQGGADKATKIVLRGGVEYARGVALNGTHYSDPILEVRRGAAIIKRLEQKGIHGKKVVINTATSGNPFEFGAYTGKDDNNAFVCKSADDDRTCVTLGIPPTAAPEHRKWGLPEKTRELAAKYVDAFVWFGRPWLYRQADPFVQKRAVMLANSSPFRSHLPYVPGVDGP